MTTLAKLFARKQQLLERLQEDPSLLYPSDPHR